MSEGHSISERKKDHIDLAFAAQVEGDLIDSRFHFEPMMAAHPKELDLSQNFLGKKINFPLWVSSMTGGTNLARKINENLAKACQHFGMGMGLGSCRILFDHKDRLDDFNVRKWIGPELPLYGNLGIAQIERMTNAQDYSQLDWLMDVLDLDGMIVHVNPLQEWLQPDGDRINLAPVDTIRQLINDVNIPIIVKEVGQGFGPDSIKALLELPLAAIDFAASGGTNFSLLEIMRSDESMSSYQPLAFVGHSALQMVQMTNQILNTNDDEIQCREIIISGGVKNFLDGYYLNSTCRLNSVYGQASALLKHAKESYESLIQYLETQKTGYLLAASYLKTVKP